jgi:hypothetical protein
MAACSARGLVVTADNDVWLNALSRYAVLEGVAWKAVVRFIAGSWIAYGGHPIYPAP